MQGINENTIPILIVLVILVGAATYVMMPTLFPEGEIEETQPAKIDESVDPCLGKVCNDYNPCTRDYCVNGICKADNVREGYPCGTNMVCKNGICVEIVKEIQEEPEIEKVVVKEKVEPFNVTNNKFNQYQPHLYENILLWTDTRNENKDIYMYNLESKSTTRITNNEADQEEACANGRGIVWTDNRHGDKDIYFFEVATNKVYNITRGEMGGITSEDMPDTFRLPHGSEKNQYAPYIYDNKIVWVDEKYEKKFIPSITLFDLDTKEFRRLMSNPKKEDQPSIWDNTVIWRVFDYGRTATIADIVAFDLETNNSYNIASTSLHESEPFVNDGKVVYLEGKTLDNDVMVYDMKTKQTRKIAGGEGIAYTRPRIDGNIVAYAKKMGNQWDIYVFDLEESMEYQVTNTLQDETFPVLDGDYLAWVGGEIDDKDIYLLNLTDWLKQ